MGGEHPEQWYERADRRRQHFTLRGVGSLSGRGLWAGAQGGNSESLCVGTSTHLSLLLWATYPLLYVLYTVHLIGP
jgi:hypothetical protein